MVACGVVGDLLGQPHLMRYLTTYPTSSSPGLPRMLGKHLRVSVSSEYHTTPLLQVHYYAFCVFVLLCFAFIVIMECMKLSYHILLDSISSVVSGGDTSTCATAKATCCCC